MCGPEPPPFACRHDGENGEIEQCLEAEGVERADIAAKPSPDQAISISRSVSVTIAIPSTTATITKPPMLQVSGFLDHRT